MIKGVHPSAECGGHGLPAGTHDVAFDGDVVDAGFGLMSHFKMPGGVRVMLYLPHYRKGSD